MIFNGHTEQYINSLDEELFAEIQVMYADGMVGNKAIYNALTPITTALFNYMRNQNQRAFKSKNREVPPVDEVLGLVDPSDFSVADFLNIYTRK